MKLLFTKKTITLLKCIIIRNTNKSDILQLKTFKTLKNNPKNIQFKDNFDHKSFTKKAEFY